MLLAFAPGIPAVLASGNLKISDEFDHALTTSQFFCEVSALIPTVLMAGMAAMAGLHLIPAASLWRWFLRLAGAGLVLAGCALFGCGGTSLWPGFVTTSTLSLVVAFLVQLLGTVIAGFSARYLQGETGQHRFVGALAAVLASVHLLLMADHWLVLIVAWASVGAAMKHLLCFYPDRPFALLAAHKKQIADRAADALLLGAAALAWFEVGSGSLSALSAHVTHQEISLPLQLAALALVVAVVLRTALFPVHGWLIQVMEAPTPVSALLHAGVVNLGGFVLIRCAPLLEKAVVARSLLLLVGLATAMLAGMVMLTRVSIKVRLAWSTVAQMGFMMLECALGLYTLALLHLIGHSLYKANAFLAASGVVRKTRLHALHVAAVPGLGFLFAAPLLACATVFLVLTLAGHTPWPWWWSAVLGLAWAPLLWLPAQPASPLTRGVQTLFGLSLVTGLTIAAMAGHALPLGIHDAPQHQLGMITLAGMMAMYLCQALLQHRPTWLERWRRWSYAGFYVDEAYTRLALRLWPTVWAPVPARAVTITNVPS